MRTLEMKLVIDYYYKNESWLLVYVSARQEDLLISRECARCSED